MEIESDASHTLLKPTPCLFCPTDAVYVLTPSEEWDGMCCAPANPDRRADRLAVLHNWQLHSDPHLAARQSFIGIDHPDTGVLPYPAFPWSFSLTKPAVRMAAPRFAEGNAYVFREVLGMSEGAVRQLYDERVTADQPEKMMIIFA